MHLLRGIVAKIFVYTLFGLLIVSFAIWGIGDIFRGGTQNPVVATVGEREIEEAEFRRQMAQEISALQQRLGQRIDSEMARAIGLPQQVLNRLVVDALFAQQAEDLELVVTDDTLRNEILADPRFQDALGNFDRNRFEGFLRNQRIGEAQFLERLATTVVRTRIVQALGGGVAVPEPMAETLYRYRAQRRVADYVELPAESVGPVDDPDAETLQAFYEEVKGDFMAPEYRSVAYIPLRPQALFPEMQVSEEALREAYEARKDGLGTPARREVSQMIFDTEEAAQQAVQRLDEDGNFASVAQELTGNPPIDFGMVTRADLPDQLAGEAFALEPGSVSQPVETDFGWHVLRVGDAIAGETPSFAEVRDELRQDLLMADAIDALVSIANQLDDELAGGATLEEAAQSLNLPLESVEVSRDGLTPADEPVEGLAASPRFLETVFATQPGETSLLLETDRGSYFVARVEGVTPAAPRPLEEIRSQVVEAWKREERNARLLERADEIAARLGEGQTLERVAEQEGLTVQTTQPLTRDASDPGTTPAARLAGQLFGLKPGEATIAASPNGQVVAVLQEIVEAQPQANPQQVAQLRTALEDALTGDLLNLYGTDLQEDIGIGVDQAAIDRVLADF